MSKYIIDIDTIDNVTVTTLSDGIPLIYKDAIKWMNTSFLDLSLNIEDGEYFAKLKVEAQEEILYMLGVNVKDLCIIKVNDKFLSDD